MRGGHDSAISDVIGNVLLVAITVGLTALFVLFIIAARPGPTDKLHADLAVEFEPVAATICDSETAITVTHGGGEALRLGTAKIVLEGGGTLTTFENTGLETDPLLSPPLQALDVYQSGFDLDGVMGIGERWVACVGFPPATDVTVTLIQKGGDAQVMQSSVLPSITKDCSSDAIGPTVSALDNAPDVTTQTLTDVVISVRLSDNCAGVDVADAPHLFYFIGAPPDVSPPFGSPTGDGDMVFDAGTTWTFTIAARNWRPDAFKFLQYYVEDYSDELGNLGDPSSIELDSVDVVPFATTYVNNLIHPYPTATVANFAEAQSDSSGEALFDENNTATAGAPDRYATTFDATSTALNPNRATGQPDDAWTEADAGGEFVSVDGFLAGAGAITAVDLMVEGHTTGTDSGAADEFELTYSIGAGPSSQIKLVSFADLTDQEFSFPIFSDNSLNGGSWDWADISAMEITMRYDRRGGPNTIVMHVDAAWVRVTWVPVSYELDVSMEFTAVPAGTAYLLEFRYQTSGDTFLAQICDPCSPTPTWNSIPGTLDNPGATPVVLQYLLQGSEYNSGSPKVRILDTTPGAVQGSLFLDYLRVITI